ncbi:MAG: N-acetylglucosamine-6-phosphate deacetylase [Chloroflexota bacterium]|nr:N-acetylglucosamine-6-phosphate deacetylase [Chloroflexota bacterium]
MTRLLFTSGRIIGRETPWEPGWLLVDGTLIAGVGAGTSPDARPDGVEVIDAHGLTLLPGFIDLHVHGAMGHETMDGNPDGLLEMSRFYARHGVTSYLPSTWTASRGATLAALDAVAQALGSSSDGATILGAHMEGPYLSPDKPGAQDPSLIRRARRDEAVEFLDRGVVRLLALAPEIPENGWLIDECVRRGVTVSAGHTNARYEDIAQAASRGLRQVTHLFNAMSALGHREPGVVGAALSLPELLCELIADNVHVHPAAMAIATSAKGRSGVALISDAIRAAGLPEGEFRIDHRTVIHRAGAVRLRDGTLAGSVLTLDVALRNLIAATGRPLEQLWPTTSLNAARAIGVDARTGSLEVGKQADIVLLDEALQVAMTVVEGRIVFRRNGGGEARPEEKIPSPIAVD